ncbi:MAG: YSC84-related protein [Desulfobacteraceae bacterium]|jgi:lipid-binding SYLF domain-containing protein|nr:YSC84-related protein [Desulfobacteraceae bacterium]
MKTNAVKRTTKIGWPIRIILLIAMFSIFFANNLMAKTAKEIDASVDVAIDRFYKQVKGAENFVKASKGMLVMPNIVKGAFIVGGEYGEGALRIGGKTVSYYNTVAGSIGLQIGGQKKDIILCFMTDEALKKFRESKGWETGVDGNVALITVGAGERADTTTLKDPIVGFVFDAKGLIADISLKGAKFSKLDKKE